MDDLVATIRSIRASGAPDANTRIAHAILADLAGDGPAAPWFADDAVRIAPRMAVLTGDAIPGELTRIRQELIAEAGAVLRACESAILDLCASSREQAAA